MALNRIIDREIDAENPRTSSRHLPSGTMSIQAAWVLSGIFLAMLMFSAWMLNEVALKMSWLPVTAFVIYPYTKRVHGCVTSGLVSVLPLHQLVHGSQSLLITMDGRRFSE